MKRLIAIFLLAAVIFSLWACTQEAAGEPLEFYYPWADLPARMKKDPHCTAIGSEEREVSGNRNSLRYLLTLYFRGPLDSELISPFPPGTSAPETKLEEGELTVTLSSAFSHLEGMDLTLACACLARTCFGLTDAQSVTVRTLSGTGEPDFSLTLTRDNFLLEDSIPAPTE